VRATLKRLLPVVDLLAMPLVFVAAHILRLVRSAGIRRLPGCKRALLAAGVFPIRNHYYEPLFDPRLLRRPLDQDRVLPGIDWNVAGQLELLTQFRFNDEFKDIVRHPTDELTYHTDNPSFKSGDAEYLYNLIRLKKPARIVEIGSGYSTLMAIRATRRNEQEDPAARCRHVCIEPYEMPWLERTGVEVLRQKVEAVDARLFAELGPDDLLFIDSSHMIRPQGDVLFEFLELIPSLRPGVIVHVHDIFSPRDYLHEWVVDDVLFWNEQYLLEAFLSGNRDWKILGALNYLRNHHYDQLQTCCPLLTPDRQPGSFYMQRVA
jgi:predicted O-methyltransferase YrrM